MIAPTLDQLRVKLRDLPALVGGRFSQGVLEGSCLAITCDSRKVFPGALFAALPGHRDHGRCYIGDALERGAVGVVSQDAVTVPREVPVLVVDDARAAMARIACALYNQPSLRLKTVGVTGTNGKTTVSYLVRELLRAAGRNPGWVSTLRYDVGNQVLPASRTTPESPVLQSLLHAMVQARCDSASIEVSSHALAEQRVRGTNFDVVVFTNLTPEHLDYHENMDAYFDSKAQLFSRLGYAEPSTVSVLNVDDPWGRKLALRLGSKPPMITFGTREEARVRAEHVVMRDPGVGCHVVTPWGEADLVINLIGRFNLMNALAALAAGGALDLPLDGMIQALQTAGSVPGRLEPIENERGARIFVDYAHTADALANVLRSLRDVSDKRLLCVFGCGGDRDRTKRSEMGSVVAQGADVAIVTSDNPRSEDPRRIIDDILEGMSQHDEVIAIEDRRAAIAEALGRAEPGDTLLIAGKGHESRQEIDGVFHQFDDREVVRDLLRDA